MVTSMRNFLVKSSEKRIIVETYQTGVIEERSEQLKTDTKLNRLQEDSFLPPMSEGNTALQWNLYSLF